jgi:hypothetical protein
MCKNPACKYLLHIELKTIKKINSDHQVQQSHWPEKEIFEPIHTTFFC